MILLFRSLLVPVGSVLLAFLTGGILLFLSGSHPVEAYIALLQGAFGDGSSISRTLEKATPLILNGLAIAFALKAGLFNIGAQGQFLFGAFAAAVAGFYVQGIPSVLHIPLSIFAGMIAGGIYGLVQGALKALSGAHEVITGIMCNYIAINLTDYLVNHPFRDRSPGNIVARTPQILDTSRFPDVAGVPFGFIAAIIAAILVWWIARYAIFGFEIRAVGSGINAARYSGVRIRSVLIGTMLISGALAGLGGAVETQGIVHRFQPGFNTGLGFEGITIALLGRVHPLGIIPAAILIGAMKAGAGMMQFSAGVENEIIDVIQSLILFFVTADVILQKMFPGIKWPEGECLSLSMGWGGNS